MDLLEYAGQKQAAIGLYDVPIITLYFGAICRQPGGRSGLENMAGVSSTLSRCLRQLHDFVRGLNARIHEGLGKGRSGRTGWL